MTTLESILKPEIHLVTGKGGVGRTTFAVTLGTAFAQQGLKTLVLELSDQDEYAQSMIGRLIDQPFLKQISRASHENIAYQGDRLFFGQLNAKIGHEGFLKAVLPIASLAQAALNSKPLSRFLESAPSLYELGLFYHLWMLIQDQQYQKIVIDLPATGHTLALTRLPAQLSRMIRKGPLVSALAKGHAFLSDPSHTAIWIIALPEKLPVTEAMDLKNALKADGFKTTALVLNKIKNPDLNFNSNEIEYIEQLYQHHPNLQGYALIESMLYWQKQIKQLSQEMPVYLMVEGNAHQRLDFIQKHLLNAQPSLIKA